MKRSAAVGLLMLGTWVFHASSAFGFSGSYVPGSGINGTVHDLGTAHNGMNYTAVPADPLRRICIFCHAPHNAYKLAGAPGVGPEAGAAFDYLPLWNHTLQADTSYRAYDNGEGAPQTGAKASQAIENGMTPGSVSLLCLSCHDGSIAVNSYGNSSQTSRSTGASFIAPAYRVGGNKDLSNHHPVGFDYYAVQAGDVEIRDPDTAQLTPDTFVSDHLYANNVECGTCHSVHNTGNAGEKLLWRSDENSELCLTCHAKGIYTAPAGAPAGP